MFLLLLVALTLPTIPLARGDVRRLLEVRFRSTWLVFAALGLQIVALATVRGEFAVMHRVGYVASYVVAAAFIVANLRIAGMPVVAAGGALNVLAIVANGGVMPAGPSTLAAARLVERPGAFYNSVPVAGAKLSFLGDVFAVRWPIHEVFSVGDLVIVAGAVVVLHRASRSRWFRAKAGQFSELRRHPAFMRLWAAQAVSNVGDWIYTIAVATSLAASHGTPGSFALLFALQLAPSALIGVVGGPLVDRLPRKQLMIASDVLRMVAVASLFVGGPPSRAHLYLVAFLLGGLGALFLPSLQASLPNAVPEESIVAANAVVSTTFHAAVMLGPIIGGALVARFGAGPAFAVNAASFGLSALLLAKLHLPRPPREADDQGPVAALVEGVRYMVASPLVRRVLLVLGVLMVAASLKSPLEPLFVLRTLHRNAGALGLVGAAWGMGMVGGSLATPSLARRWARERLFAAALAAVGLSVLIASQQRSLAVIVGLWVVAGLGNGMGTVCYESLLQERVPDEMRGRVMSASEAILDGAFLIGASFAGVLGTALGVRAAFAASGVVFLVAAALTGKLIGRAPVPVKQRPAMEPPAAVPTPAMAMATAAVGGPAEVPSLSPWPFDPVEPFEPAAVLSGWSFDAEEPLPLPPEAEPEERVETPEVRTEPPLATPPEPVAGTAQDPILARFMPPFDLGHTASFTSKLPRDTRRAVPSRPVLRAAATRDWSAERSLDVPEPLRRPLARRTVARKIDRAVTEALRSLDAFGSSRSR